MSRWIWAITVSALVIAAFASDRLIWPDRTIFAFYSVPMIVASLRLQLWATLAAIIGTIVVSVDDLYLSNHTTAGDAIGLIALLVVGLFAALHTLKHQELQRRIERHEAVITTVAELRQPLAVILGYTQLLEDRAPPEMPPSQALGAIRRAALHLRDLLDAVMVKWGGQ